MDYAQARKIMVDSQVRPNDVTNPALLSAFETTPKELFLPVEAQAIAYVDKAVPYGAGRVLPAARCHAKLLQILSPKSGDLILDIACGGGYTTAILASMCEMVVGVESDEALAASAEKSLAELGIANAAVITGDIAKGAAKQGPFDCIVITAVIEQAPQALLDQLKDNGRLAAFQNCGGVVKGVIHQRCGSVFTMTEHFAANMSRILPGFEKAKEFAF